LKWIGLALCALVLLLRPWLPGLVVAIGYLYGSIVIVNLTVLLVRKLRDLLFWRVRHRLLGAFVFAGLIPLLLILGMVYFAGRILAGQLASDYLQDSVQDLARELTWIDVDLAQRTASLPAADLGRVAGEIFKQHDSKFPSLAAPLIRVGQDGASEVLGKCDPSGRAPARAFRRPS